jgi:hypothetical protein
MAIENNRNYRALAPLDFFAAVVALVVTSG